MDEIAAVYFASDDTRMIAFAILLIGGAALGVATSYGNALLQRLPFILWGALTLGGLKLAQLAAQQIYFEWGEQVIGALLIAEFGTNAIAGFVLGRLAIARARDAFSDHDKIIAMVAVTAVLFSQIAFFVLALRGSQSDKSEETTVA